MAAQLLESRHLSVLDHPSISALFVFNRGISHEEVRQRIGAAYSQESTRYCDYRKDRLGNGITVQGEYFTRTDDVDGGASEDSNGWYAMGTYTLPKSGDSAIQWGFGARVNVADVDTNFNQQALSGLAAGTLGDVTEFSLVMNAFYHGHAAKTQIELTRQEADPTGANNDSSNNIVRVQFQILF
jgi:hypothetical protein